MAARFHLAGRLEVNTWQGRQSAQLRLEDAAPALNLSAQKLLNKELILLLARAQRLCLIRASRHSASRSSIG